MLKKVIFSCSFYHYVAFFFVSYYIAFAFKFILSQISIATPSLFYLHLYDISLFISLFLVCVYLSYEGGSLVDSMYVGLVFLLIQLPCVLIGAVKPFTFK